ncbi:PREDICTED: uncharacterized protein LOC104799919 isoform X3 [Tarenaya hassleriana]|uniref:uncharacterized protein LOC104799919 isoform X3 n=1 Tax=Tarenaya hassleriana TaxID=28532 RepID=UPI00053C7536|nr:PREDICTED: uncharacterized protein LOC104799919 isoform X3 [Tarenaya hassleriana]
MTSCLVTLRTLSPCPSDKPPFSLMFVLLPPPLFTGGCFVGLTTYTVFTALGSDGGVELYWGIAADGSVVKNPNQKIHKKLGQHSGAFYH